MALLGKLLYDCFYSLSLSLSLVLFQFNDLVDLLTDMLTFIAKSQRNKLLLEKNAPMTISQEMFVHTQLSTCRLDSNSRFFLAD